MGTVALDSHGVIGCGNCGSKFRLNYIHVFPSAEGKIDCPTCTAPLLNYNEPKTYFIHEIIEVRHDHVKPD